MVTNRAWAANDPNDKNSLTAVSNADGTTIVRLTADPATGALIITSASAGGTGTWYTVSGTINSSNVTFTIPVAVTSDFLLFLDRQPQMLTTDFTYLAGGGITTITYVIAPDSSLSSSPHMAFVVS